MGDDGQRSQVSGSTEQAGDDAVREATGRERDEWFAALDEQEATEWPHREIAAWLVGEGVDPWWAQSVTVSYEQARGIRAPGQRQDGTFETSVSRTVGLRAVRALELLAAVVEGELGSPPLALNTTAKHPTARFPLDDGEFVLAAASPRADGRATISLTRGRMPDGSQLAESKAQLREWLERVG
ncbi:hypothetical protein GE115_13495 [Agromyces sp. CFH 90414]|uniref:DUF4287 domain-containing protein n=1 Tax=Agromyces agglutinans TaxID=2662258 RepID=A0A6I2F979_9MICO|nr:hypothetical protein [Agromyces agglutinans]MRG60871.1 hypothetical protein [Agromyces agglutinans]